jgi:hypothetical protein
MRLERRLSHQRSIPYAIALPLWGGEQTAFAA